jgi:TolA-binding protein
MSASCVWLIVCVLAHGSAFQMAFAAEPREAQAILSSTHAMPPQARSETLPPRIALPDDGPRYDRNVEEPGALQFQEAVKAFARGQYAAAHAGFDSLATLDSTSALIPPLKAFMAELTLLEDPTDHGRREAITQYRSIIGAYAKNPNAFRAFWRVGDLYDEMGWYQEAIIAYQYALSIDLPHHDADRSLLALGVTLGKLGRWTEAERAFETVRERAMDDRLAVRATFDLANALYVKNRKRDAVPLYDFLYRRWPSLLRQNPDALQQYGEVLFDANEPQRTRAVDTLLYNLYPSHPHAGAALVRLGDIHRRLELLTQAEMFYRAAQAQYAGTLEAGIASMHLAKMEQEVAVSAGESFLKKKVEGIIRGASASYLEPSEGETLYKTIAQEHPKDVLGSEALFQLAEHFKLRNAPSRAIQTYVDVTRRAGVVEDDPWPQAAKVRLAVLLKPQLEAALKAKNDMQVAILFHSLGQAPEQHYIGTRLLLEVAETHRRLGFSAEAARIYQVLVRDRKAASLHESALIGLGESYLDQREPAAARNVFESFRLQYPQSPQSMLVLRQLTTAMREQGDRRSAIRLMRQWLRAHPREEERGWMQLTLAKTLVDDHQTGEAVAAFEEASRHKYMESQSDRLLFADLLTSVNKYQQAVDLYQGILASHPTPDQAEWARLQIVRNLATQKLYAPVRAVLTPGADTGDPLMYRAALAIQAGLRVTTEKEGGG